MKPDRGGSYRRLPGRARLVFGLSTLWYASDHLLLVKRQGFGESYQRYYFRDIQSITSHRTDRDTLLWGIHIVVALLLAVPTALALIGGKPERWWWSIAAAIVLYSLVVHWWRGSTCSCRMRTILQEVELTPLRRERWLRRTFAIIDPLIRLSQGGLDQAALAEQLRSSGVVDDRTSSREEPSGKPPAPPPPIGRGNLVWHSIICYLFIIDATVSIGQVLMPNTFLTMMGAILALSEFGVVILTLTRQNSSLIGRALRPFTWTAFGVLCLAALGSWVAMFIRTLQTQGAVNPATLSGPKWYSVVYIVVYYSFGIIGLTLIRRHRFENEHQWLKLNT